MQSSLPYLPIDDVLAEICAGLRDHARLVLAAPPGAVKTTRVPLALAGLAEQMPEGHAQTQVKAKAEEDMRAARDHTPDVDKDL